MTLFLLIAAVCTSLGISALCSLMEATLLSLTPGRVAEMKRSKPAAGAVWERFKQDVERPISVILILNTAAHTIGATVAGASFESLMEERYGAGGWSVFAFGAVFTVLMLQFTEILPKTMGVRHSVTIAKVTARPMNWLVWLMGPVLAVVKFVNRPFEGRGQDRHQGTLEEIAGLAREARGGEVIDAQQERMIRAAGRLGEVTAREVMTPRPDVQVLKLGDDLAALLRTLRESPYTRLPVVDGGLDKVRGVVHLRDVFRLLELAPGRIRVQPDPDRPGELVAIPHDKPGGDLHAVGAGRVDLEKVMRPVKYVPDVAPIQALLKDFQRGDSHLAVVVDEHGSAAGVVSLEDVLEELVGEIEDEHDPAAEPDELFEERGQGWHVGGEVALRHVADRLDFAAEAFGETRVVTIGGWLTQQLGRAPEVGDAAEVGGWRMVVDHAERGRVVALSLEPAAETVEAEG